MRTVHQRPRVLVTVEGGVASVCANPSEVEIYLIDYDNEPDACLVPEEFRGLPDYWMAQNARNARKEGR